MSDKHDDTGKFFFGLLCLAGFIFVCLVAAVLALIFL
jgi:hypothetical protein